MDISFSPAPLGHRLLGVDIAAGVPDAQFTAIEEAFDRYGVVVLPQQHLTPDQQIAFSKRFGPLEEYFATGFLLPGHPEVFVVSNIVEQGKAIGMADAGRNWHSDMCFTTNPPRCSLLYALEVPHDDNGQPLGDTCFASTQAAYDALEPSMKALVNKLHVRTSASHAIAQKAKQQLDAGGQASQEERRKAAEKFPDVIHPVVRVHPVTGRKCLYLSETLSAGIVGMSASEGEALIANLLAHMVRPEFVYRHRWQEGDIVIWDNCSAIHRATPDFTPAQRRLMHRTTVENTAKATGVFAG